MNKSSVLKTLVILGVAAFLILFGITEAEASNHSLTRTLRRGMRGQDVAVVQRLLKDEGIYRHPEITSFFGSITHRAIREFQRRNNLAIDGIIGPRTRTVMNALLDRKAAASRADRPNMHIVQANDTMWKISRRYGVTLKSLLDANGMTEGTQISLGQRITRHNIPIKPTPGDRYGELLEWSTEAQYVFHLNAVATITDFLTGISFNVRRTYGSGHADVEPMTAQDTKIMQSIWQEHEKLPNGTIDFWAQRAVIVQVGNRRLAASANGMLHAGADSQPAGDVVSWRSAGFGPGYNLDMVKGNGAHGHFCIHFLDSNRHVDWQIDANHQAMVRIAAGK